MYCYVTNCPNSAKNSKNKKRDDLTKYFPSPENKTLLEKWRRVIPRGDKLLCQNDRLCDLHFLSSEVVWFTETKLPNGNVRRLLRDEPILRPGTIPSIFPSDDLDAGNTTVKTAPLKERLDTLKSNLRTPTPIIKPITPRERFVTSNSISKTPVVSKNVAANKGKIETPRSGVGLKPRDPVSEKRLPQRVKRRSTILDDYVTDDELNQVHHHERRKEGEANRSENSSKRRRTDTGLQPVIRLVPLECLMDKKGVKQKVPAQVNKTENKLPPSQVNKTPGGRRNHDQIDHELKKVIEIPLLTIGQKPKKAVTFRAKDTVQFKPPKKTITKAKAKYMFSSASSHQAPSSQDLHSSEGSDADEESNEVKPDEADIEEELARMEMDEDNEDIKTPVILSSDVVSETIDTEDVVIKSEEEDDDGIMGVTQNADSGDLTSENLENITIKSEDEEAPVAEDAEEGVADSEVLENQSTEAAVSVSEESLQLISEDREGAEESDSHVDAVGEDQLVGKSKHVDQEPDNGKVEGDGDKMESEKGDGAGEKMESVNGRGAGEEVVNITDKDSGEERDQGNEIVETNEEGKAGKEPTPGEKTSEEARIQEVEDIVGGEGVDNIDKLIDPVECAVISLSGKVEKATDGNQVMQVEPTEVGNQQDDETNENKNKEDQEDEIMKLLAEGQNSEPVCIVDDSLDLLTDSEVKDSAEQPVTDEVSKPDNGEQIHTEDDKCDPDDQPKLAAALEESEKVESSENTIPEHAIEGSVSGEGDSEASVEEGNSKPAVSVEGDSTANKVNDVEKEAPSSMETDEQSGTAEATADSQADALINVEEENEEKTAQANDEIDLTLEIPENDNISVSSDENRSTQGEMEQTEESSQSANVETSQANNQNENEQTINIDDDDSESMDTDAPVEVEDMEEGNDEVNVETEGETAGDPEGTGAPNDEEEVSVVSESGSVKESNSKESNEEEIDIEAEVARLVSEVEPDEEPKKKNKNKDESSSKEKNQSQEVVIHGNTQLATGEVNQSVQNLFTPETIQEILKQIKLPLTAPVTFRIAPVESDATAPPKTVANNKTTKKRGGGRGGGRAQLMRPSGSSTGLAPNSIEQFKHLTKTRTVFEFPSFISDIEDDVQFWKLCQIVKESYHELIEARNTKTSIGKLTLSISVNRPKSLHGTKVEKAAVDSEGEACGSVNS